MLRAVTARRLGVQYRPLLTCVEMPPAPLCLRIVKRALRTAFRAPPCHAPIVRPMHMHFPFRQLYIDALYAPRLTHSQNLGIQVSVLHLLII